MEVIELLTNYLTPPEIEKKIKEFIKRLRAQEEDDEEDEDYMFTKEIFEEKEIKIKDI